GAVVIGPDIAERVRMALLEVDALSLLVEREEDIAWLWLGSRRRRDPDSLFSLFLDREESPLTMSVGEPGRGPEGWRLTHRQALASVPAALRSPRARARYRDVAILSSVLQDDLLATSLRHLYLDPLERERDGGLVARTTLRAYLDSRCIVSSTASLLGITRKTVTARLRAIERLIDRPLDSCWTDVAAALQLDEADRRAPTHSA
ncbi:MAG TPA: helix-turn-helix domain-containing protein, partial [Chloroflexota bacterium]|nr:helix-turn-helix domain-containing protein [Chloroflexota bacterium]